MWPDRVLNPGPLTYESGALPTALRVPAAFDEAWSLAANMWEDKNTMMILKMS